MEHSWSTIVLEMWVSTSGTEPTPPVVWCSSCRPSRMRAPWLSNSNATRASLLALPIDAWRTLRAARASSLPSSSPVPSLTPGRGLCVQRHAHSQAHRGAGVRIVYARPHAQVICLCWVRVVDRDGASVGELRANAPAQPPQADVCSPGPRRVCLPRRELQHVQTGAEQMPTFACMHATARDNAVDVTNWCGCHRRPTRACQSACMPASTSGPREPSSPAGAAGGKTSPCEWAFAAPVVAAAGQVLRVLRSGPPGTMRGAVAPRAHVGGCARRWCGGAPLPPRIPAGIG